MPFWPGWVAVALLCAASAAFAHGVAAGDKAFLERTTRMQLLPFVYLGAKHMVTGYDYKPWRAIRHPTGASP